MLGSGSCSASNGPVQAGGSANLAPTDFLATDEDILWLHSRGHYGNGLRVKPRQLHISL